MGVHKLLGFALNFIHYSMTSSCTGGGGGGGGGYKLQEGRNFTSMSCKFHSYHDYGLGNFTEEVIISVRELY